MYIEQCDAAVAAMLKIEDAMLRLRKELCAGSMLRGWQIKSATEVSEAQVLIEFNEVLTAAHYAIADIHHQGDLK